MALVQTSLSGGRTTGGNHVQYVLVGTGSAQSDAPALGDNITSFTGGAGQPSTPSTTGMTTLLCSESGSVPHPQFKGKWAVRAVFDALRTITISGLTLPTGWFAIEVSPGISGDLRRGVGKVVVLDAPSTADNKVVQAAYPWTVYPGESGLFAPYMQRYRIRAASRPTRNEVTLYYDPPTIRQVVESNPDRGFLTVDIVDSEFRPSKDDEGNPVWLVEYNETSHEVYRHTVVGGKGTKAENRFIFRLQFVSNIGWMHTLAALKKTTNAQAMPNWGGAGAETLRIVGVHGERALTVDALNHYWLTVEANPDGWNQETKVQKQKRIGTRFPARDENGVLIPGKWGEEVAWKNVGNPYQAKFYTPASWAALDKLLA